MRFADAVAELEGAGMQVHRSFWVAYRHITAIEQREGRIVVCLTGGEVVPVSRTFIAAVRAAASRETISFVS
jgi:DNA-binding LytR/AlgR family response regulator